MILTSKHLLRLLGCVSIVGTIAAGTAIPGPAQAQPTSQSFPVKLGERSEARQALLCTPPGAGPWPVIVFNHGSIVDGWGWPGASQRGYRLDKVCDALAAEGFLVFAPIRETSARGKGFMAYEEAYREIVNQAVDHARSLKGADASRLILAGFSMGGLTAFRVAQERKDLRALVLLAPAYGRGLLEQFAQDAARINAPTLVMIEESDTPPIKRGVAAVAEALRTHDKPLTVVRHHRGGGHELYYDVGYWFDDLKPFLKTHGGMK